MISFIIFVTLAIPVFTAPQGYEYKPPAPVIEQNGFQPSGPPIIPPCNHIDDASLALIHSQSEGRIVNHKTNYGTNHNLVAAASGYAPQSQSTNLNTISVSQDSAKSHNIGSITTQFLPHINSSPQFVTNDGSKLQTSSIRNPGYSYTNNQHTLAANGLHLSNQPPQFSTSHNSFRPYVTNHQVTNEHRPLTPSLVGNIVAPRPVQVFGNAGHSSYQHNSGSYAHSFGHTTNSAASLHNIQQISQENSVLSTAGNEAFSSSAINQQSASLNSVKHTTNINTELNIGGLNGQLGHVIRETFANAPLDPSIEKHIYVHVPPEDLEEDNSQKSVTQQQLSVPPKKHYKIIFIKAPSYPTPNYNQLAAAVAPQTEEKTLVYVLVKKPESPSIEQIQQIQQSSFKSSKPEVYFIKYKTRKENDSSQYSVNSQNTVETIETPQPEIIPTENGSGLIDIRAGGNSNSISTSYSSSSQTVINNEPKHELYGVPLQ